MLDLQYGLLYFFTVHFSLFGYNKGNLWCLLLITSVIETSLIINVLCIRNEFIGYSCSNM